MDIDTPDGEVPLSTTLQLAAESQIDGLLPSSVVAHPSSPVVSNSEAKVSSRQSSSRLLRVFVGTWNMYGRPAPSDGSLASFIPPTEFDCYAIGTEECERSIQKSIFFPSKENWERQLLQHFDDQHYFMVSSATCGSTHIAVFVKKSLESLVSDIDSASVVTGIAQQDAVKARNADFHRISEQMNLGCLGNQSSNAQFITDRFDRVFWSGDLNYRVQTTRKMANHVLEQQYREVMLANDQLNIERLAGRVFQGFSEAPIEFPPTYKYDPETDLYDTSRKARVPSWTDRVLFKPGPFISCEFYEAVQSIRTSDHKPVRAAFRVSIDVENESIVQEVPEDLLDISSAKCCNIL